jgi:hypothetical protein
MWSGLDVGWPCAGSDNGWEMRLEAEEAWEMSGISSRPPGRTLTANIRPKTQPGALMLLLDD